MAYPNPTTYQLPLGDSIRVSSARRFVLVRHHGQHRPVVVRRSDSFAPVYREYNQLAEDTDYIIDQAEGTVLFAFNGCHHVQSISPGSTMTIRNVQYGQVTEASLARRVQS